MLPFTQCLCYSRQKCRRTRAQAQKAMGRESRWNGACERSSPGCWPALPGAVAGLVGRGDGAASEPSVRVRSLVLKCLIFNTFPLMEAPHEVFLARARRWEGRTKFVWSGHGGGKAARSFFGPGTPVGGRREVFLVRARRWEGLTKFVRSGHGGGKTARSFFGPGTAVGGPHEVCAEVPFRGPGRGKCAPRPLLREACFSDGPRVVSSGMLSNVLP